MPFLVTLDTQATTCQVAIPFRAGFYPDADLSGSVNANDQNTFNTLFAARDPYADANGDLTWNATDVTVFQAAYKKGTPTVPLNVTFGKITSATFDTTSQCYIATIQGKGGKLRFNVNYPAMVYWTNSAGKPQGEFVWPNGTGSF
jgi:hypothetical protein